MKASQAFHCVNERLFEEVKCHLYFLHKSLRVMQAHFDMKHSIHC